MAYRKSPYTVILEHFQLSRDRRQKQLKLHILPILHVTAVLAVVFVMEGSHQNFIDKTKTFWLLWLLLLGLLQGGPLREGLPTHIFRIYPHIIRVSIGSQVCTSLWFQCPPYPEVIKCPEIPERSPPSSLQIVIHLFPELLFWSIGSFCMNFIFFMQYSGVPSGEVAAVRDRIQKATRDRIYYKKLEILTSKYRKYFSFPNHELLFQDADVSAALAGLKRTPMRKYVMESLMYSVLGMNLLLTPGLISLVCVLGCKLIRPGFAILSLLSIDATDALYTPEEGIPIMLLKILRDVVYYAAVLRWLQLFLGRSRSRLTDG